MGLQTTLPILRRNVSSGSALTAALARPAWARTLDLYAERLGADRAAID